MLYIDPWLYLATSLLILVLPVDWLLGSVVAAIFHEICHLAAVYCLHGTVTGIKVGIGGASIRVTGMDTKAELLAALAGPAGSMVLRLFLRWIPQVAVSGLVQGCFNLLPVSSMDGGRILDCCMDLLLPHRTAGTGIILKTMACFGYFGMVLWIMKRLL